jgi:hypothetical protein
MNENNMGMTGKGYVQIVAEQASMAMPILAAELAAELTAESFSEFCY